MNTKHTHTQHGIRNKRFIVEFQQLFVGDDKMMKLEATEAK